MFAKIRNLKWKSITIQGRGRNKQNPIKWLYWPTKINSWVIADDLKVILDSLCILHKLHYVYHLYEIVRYGYQCCCYSNDRGDILFTYV